MANGTLYLSLWPHRTPEGNIVSKWRSVLLVMLIICFRCLYFKKISPFEGENKNYQNFFKDCRKSLTEILTELHLINFEYELH